MKCLKCNNEIIAKANQRPSDVKKKKYCSLSCTTSHLNTLRRLIPKTQICLICKNKFTIKRLRKYCSNDCRRQARINKLITKGQLYINCKDWQSARATIRKMAFVTFNRSSKPKRCIICNYDKHIEVAHIKAVKDFGDNVLLCNINDINNLVALCPTHHWEYDNDMLSLI